VIMATLSLKTASSSFRPNAAKAQRPVRMQMRFVQ
jgi:hypothetical protein